MIYLKPIKLFMVLVMLINVLGFECYQIHPIELQECRKFFLLSAKFGRTDIRKHFFLAKEVFLHEMIYPVI